MKTLLVVVATLLAAGCADRDLCQDHDGTCIGLRVHGSGSVAQIDQLHVEVLAQSAGTMKTLKANLPGTAASLVDLPISGAVYLDETVLGGATLYLQGLAGGRVIASGLASVQVEAKAHYEISATLAAAPGGGTPCPADGVATFCDDFEADGTPSAPVLGTWSPGAPDIIVDMTPGSAVSLGIDDAEVFRGRYSLHSDVEHGGIGLLTHYFPTPLTTGTVAARGYLYVDHDLTGTASPFVISSQDHDIDFSIGPSGPSVLDSGHWEVTQGAVTVYGPAATLGAWQCVEVVVDLDQHTASLYATDAFAPDPHAAPVVQLVAVDAATYGKIDVGMPSSTGNVRAWLDDFVFATQRIGCE